MRRGRPRHDDVLTPREWEVLDLLREGLANEQIAGRLGVSLDTAKFHVSEILGKLGVESRQEAAAWQGRPKVAFGLAPIGWLIQKPGGISPWKLVGAGAIGVAGVALVLLALGVLVNGGGDSLGKIAFVRDGNIWAQELPDGAPYQLTQDGGASGPQWSPSGEWLLYRVRDEDADEPPGLQLWLVRADGTDHRLVADNGYYGQWLPEEDERVLYLTSGEETIAEDANGSDRETLFAPFEDGGDRVTRSWYYWPSPDGEHQLYFETRELVDPPIRGAPSPPTSIYVSKVDGTDPTLLTTIDPTAESQLVPLGWSSDGSHVLLAEITDAVQGLAPPVPVLAVPIEGGEPVPLGLNISLTAWGNEHASGRLVVAGVGQASWTDKRVALIAPDASGYTLLTPPEVAAVSPRWSPDGEQIAYVAAPDGGPDAREAALSSRRLWLMAPDGTNQRPITAGEGFRDEAPMWSSDGEYLLFARLSEAGPCYGSYDLMRYRLDEGSLEVLSAGLPVLGTYYDVDRGEIPECDLSVDGITTDFLGNLQLSSVFHWWQSAGD